MPASATYYPDWGVRSDIDYFDNIVRADMKEFIDNPHVRQTLHLATSLNNLLDWHFHSRHEQVHGQKNKPALDKFRREMELKLPALASIRDLCDASKHCRLDHGYVQLLEIKVMVGRGGYGGYSQEMGYGVAGAYGGGQPEPRQITRDSEPKWLIEVFQPAFRFWEAEISAPADPTAAGSEPAA
jgi:hypothetical protein